MRDHSFRTFILLFIGQTVSQLGSSMTGFAVVIWAYTQNGQVMASSLLAVCGAVPYLITSLLGGAVTDRTNKKKIMLVCDSVAALGSLLLLICFFSHCLQLWILCIINVVNGFMNAFQAPASQVAVSLLVEKKDYVRASGMQSVAGAVSGIFTPILAAALLGLGGLGLILTVDLITFLFAFTTLLFFVKIPESAETQTAAALHTLLADMKEGLLFLKAQKGILLLLVSYSVLEFMGAVSFDSMYSPLLLARTGNDEAIVAIVSAAMAAGCMASSLLLTFRRQPSRKVPAMFLGSFICLCGILFFGMGRRLIWWCVVAFCGCFGSPIYSTFQTVILRERVPLAMQGRLFSLQGMITQILAPVGYLLGAVLADYVFEPFMTRDGALQDFCAGIVGTGDGAGMGLLFVLAGFTGLMVSLVLCRNPRIRGLDG